MKASEEWQSSYILLKKRKFQQATERKQGITKIPSSATIYFKGSFAVNGEKNSVSLFFESP